MSIPREQISRKPDATSHDDHVVDLGLPYPPPVMLLGTTIMFLYMEYQRKAGSS